MFVCFFLVVLIYQVNLPGKCSLYRVLRLSLPDDVEFEVATDSGATSVRMRSGAPPRVVLAGQIGPEATFPIFEPFCALLSNNPI